MKRLLITAIICAAATGAFAQNGADTTHTVKKDTVIKKEKEDSYGVIIKFGGKRDSTKLRGRKAPGFSMGITFSRFDIGLATLIDNGSMTLSPANNFLSYRAWKTSNVGFDVLQMGYRFNSNFKIYASAGFDWTHIRLRENITIQKNPSRAGLVYTTDAIEYSKNRFSSSYLRIPLSFDFRTKVDDDGQRFHFVAGPDIGILLNGRVKQISEENGKQKFNDDFHFTKLRYGAFARVGYGGFGVFAKYYFNDMFDTEAQKGLKNLSFGLMIGF